MAHLLPLLLLLPLLAAAQSDGDDCLFVDGRDGICKPLPHCAELLQLLHASPTRPTFDLLSRSNCGYQGKVPVVCCPQPKTQPNEFPATAALPASISEQPSDVSLHPRVRLLPSRACGQAYADRIVGGNETGLFEFPWMALLGYKRHDKFYGFRCGGTLINQKYVLTAAHCIPNQNDRSDLKLCTIRLGEHDLTSTQDCEDNGLVVCAPKPQEFEVEYAIGHPSFTTDKLQNDVGLVRIRGEAQFTDTVKPICLPVGEEQQHTNPDESMIVAGWGVTETGTSSSKLLKVTIPVVPIHRCGVAYKRTSAVINIKQICAGGSEGRDSCAGDSGGPLMTVDSRDSGAVMVQYGIVSFGPKKCASDGYPGVYTRVAYYMDWILDNMQP